MPYLRYQRSPYRKFSRTSKLMLRECWKLMHKKLFIILYTSNLVKNIVWYYDTCIKFLKCKGLYWLFPSTVFYYCDMFVQVSSWSCYILSSHARLYFRCYCAMVTKSKCKNGLFHCSREGFALVCNDWAPSCIFWCNQHRVFNQKVYRKHVVNNYIFFIMSKLLLFKII